MTDTQNIDANSNNNDTAVNNNSNITPKNAESLSFKLEMPDNKSFIDFLNLGLEELQDDEMLGNPAQSISFGSIDKLNPRLIKNLQLFASKNHVPFKIKDTNDIKLLVYSKNIFNCEKNSSFKIDKLDENDIDFLKKCADNPNMIVNSVNPQNMVINYTQYSNIQGKNTTADVSYKSLNVSKSLVNLIDYAYKSQKPVRLDFEGNSSVILKIDIEGKLTAEFISSDKAMESLLKSSILQLRNKMDNEGIPYRDIYYKDQHQRNNNQQEDKSYE
jgi:hypothetical protein